MVTGGGHYFRASRRRIGSWYFGPPSDFETFPGGAPHLRECKESCRPHHAAGAAGRGQPCWLDRGYNPEAAAEMVRSDEAIRSASLSQIKTMLTFRVRGERFCDGHWGAMIREGRIGAILRRLQELRETVR